MLHHTQLLIVLLVFDVWRDGSNKLDKSLCTIGGANAVKPVLDLANNMRMVLVPGKKTLRLSVIPNT